MTSKTTIYVAIVCTILITFFAGFYAYPAPFNQFADQVEKSTHIKIPKFPEKNYRLGLDLRGGVELLYQIDLSQIKDGDYNTATEVLKESVERRLVEKQVVSEAEIQIQKDQDKYFLSVKIPGIGDPNEAIKEIGKMPNLEFREPGPNYEIAVKKREEFNNLTAEQQNTLMKDMTEFQQTGTLAGKSATDIAQIKEWDAAFSEPFLPAQLTGRYIEKATVEMEQTGSNAVVSLKFNAEGAKLFEEITGRNIDKPLAIYIDGELVSAPMVKSKIAGGSAQISGKFTVEQATKLANNLNEGALPVPVQLISQKTVGPTLGEESLQKTLKAGLIGFILVVLFMVIFYHFAGFLASVSLFIYVVLTLALFKLFGFTLTLPGIGALILSLGMAVDANVLIFSRMREEMKLGKGFALSVEEGCSRAWPAIRDGNLNTLFEVFILFMFGAGFVKGFATTLGIGIILSLFCAVYVSRFLLLAFSGTKLEKITWLW